jgi:hypothetical protein
MRIKNILASGCSFTHDAIGGLPPTESIGGNSFREDPDYQCSVPKSWASFLAKKINPDSFVNVASPGHGNHLVSKTIVDCLEKFNYRSDNTLVIFNVSDMARLDIETAYNTDNDNIHWTQAILDYSFLKPESLQWRQHLLDTEVEQIEQQSVRSLKRLFEYLKDNEYPFVFVCMKDYTDMPLIQQYQDHLVPLPGNGMYEFCNSINRISKDDFHPDPLGHQAVAELAYNFIHKKYKPGE